MLELAATNLIAGVIGAILLSGSVIVLLLAGSVEWKIRKSRPFPQKLKDLNREDRRNLRRLFRGKIVDVDPDLADTYASYVISSAPLYRRGVPLCIAFLVLLWLGLISIYRLDLFEDPLRGLFIIVAPFLVVSGFLFTRHLNRFVAHWSGSVG